MDKGLLKEGFKKVGIMLLDVVFDMLEKGIVLFIPCLLLTFGYKLINGGSTLILNVFGLLAIVIGLLELIQLVIYFMRGNE